MTASNPGVESHRRNHSFAMSFSLIPYSAPSIHNKILRMEISPCFSGFSNTSQSITACIPSPREACDQRSGQGYEPNANME